MAESLHFRELLLYLNDFEVQYLIVGGYAVMKYTEPRYTKDLDIWVERSHANSLRVFEALTQFGAPLKSDGITAETFTHDRMTYQIGIAPVRIDILTAITGVEFSDAWEKRVNGNIFGISTHFISLDKLILNKQATGRNSDLEQLKQLSKSTEPRNP